MTLRKQLAGCATLFCLALIAAALPALAAASSISGTVTAEGGTPIEGVEVCPWPEPYEFETTCVDTDAAGQYTLSDLPGHEYRIAFSAAKANLKYVSEYYDDEIAWGDADFFALGDEEAATVDAELAEGGSIAGTVVDETNDQPIEGLWACAWAEWVSRCAQTDAAGAYLINGLPTGSYVVEFRGENIVNYLVEYYEDTDNVGTSTHVAVTAPATTAEINAALAPGAEILGRVTEIGTGQPLEDEMVCAEEPGFEGWEQAGCDWTDGAGEYAIRGLPAGSYVVSFGLEYTPGFETLLRGQWWQGAASREEATQVVIAPPETRTGIDGELPDPFAPWEPEPEPGPASGSGSAAPLTSTPPPAIKPPLRRCKKGFRRKLVKGKKRCVRKHSHRRKHRR